MNLYVCRHGRTEANASGLLLGRADPELDEVGNRQARSLAASVPDPVLVVTSPLLRCRQTAAAFEGTEIRVDNRLIELDYGAFDLRPLAEVPAETWEEWRADVDFRPPGGETLRELGDRVASCLDELAAEVDGGDVVLVTHVSPIKAAVAWALDVSMALSWRCFVAQASVTEIGVASRGPSLRMFNGTSHLESIEG